jgi:VWFA-related protein
MRRLAVVAALALAAGAAPHSQSAPAPQSIAVRIDLVATDARGRILDNLKPADFEVKDDGVAQPIESVRLVRPPSDDGRLIALYLDEYHVSRELSARVRETLGRFLERSITDRDQLVVMKPLDSLLDIRTTRGRDGARAAIDSFEGRKGEYEPRNAYERNFMAGVPARIESARTQVAISAINALAVHFSHFPDLRKTLIVVSEGMERGDRRRGMEFLATADTIVRSANHANVAIYAVNPGAAPPEADTLQPIALETVGGVIAADLDEGLRRAMDDASGYYLLSYGATRPDDGRFHAVQVRVKRPAAQVRARKGYFAPSPDDTLRAQLLARLNEPKPVVPLEPAPHASPLIRPWFGTSRGADGKTRVTFVWEPAARLTGDRFRRTPARLVLTALAPDNTVLFEGPVNPTSAALIDDAVGVPSRATFDAPPGRVRLRMSIQDAARQQLDADVRSVTVRDMQKGVTIGTPEVLRARNAREFRALDTPLGVPVSSREFSRTERLLVRFYAYGPGDAPVAVSARLLSRMGPMRDLAINDGTSGPYQIDLPLAGLAAGEYLIEVSASGPAGDAKDVIDFRVTT